MYDIRSMSIRRENRQLSLITPDLEDLVPKNNFYRELKKLVDFDKLCYPLEAKYCKKGRSGYPVTTGFKCLVIQFMQDLSDRQLEEHLRDSLSAKLFCGFDLYEKTPDHSYLGRFRKRIGTKLLSKLFKKINSSLKEAGQITEVFTFVDASAIKSQVDVWKARDKAIADKKNKERDDDDNPTMNNKNIKTYSSDPEARYGAKGKNKIWCGYKRHVSVDMTTGLINKVAVTPANVTDSKGAKHVCPNGGMIFADKAYSEKPAQNAFKAKGCHSGAIKKNNMKDKDRDKDRWISRVRMPYEGVFAHQSNFARYRGVVKTQFQAFMQAIVFNFKRLVVIKSPPLNFDTV